MIEAVIFDMDGLLIDSEPIWSVADRIFLEKKGVKYPKEFKEKVLGIGQKEYIEYIKKRFGIKGTNEELIAERRRILYGLFSKLRLMDGGETIIKSLSKKFKLAVATGGHKKEKVKEILGNFGLLEYFDVIVSSDDIKRGKPYPDIFLETARQLGVDPSNCLVLEDAHNGVMAGKAAGMIVYGVNKDDETRKKLKEAGADKVFKSLVEVDELSPTRS